MPKNYLQLTPVTGKWYVSERVCSESSRSQAIDPTQKQADRSPSVMILAGPFDTHAKAKDWNILANASGYIWEKS